MRDVDNVIRAAHSIAHWVFCDVGGMLDPGAVQRALEKDMAAGATLPTEAEIEELVCGESGTPELEALNKRYPALDAFLTEQLT